MCRLPLFIWRGRGAVCTRLMPEGLELAETPTLALSLTCSSLLLPFLPQRSGGLFEAGLCHLVAES